MPDSATIRNLDRAECWQRLRDHPARVGRLAFVNDGLPVIIPVNYRVDGESIVFRTNPGAKLAAATDGHMVAFESDDVDIAWQSGWSVLLRGKAEYITGRQAVERLGRLGLRPWAPGSREHWVRLRPIRIEGREFT